MVKTMNFVRKVVGLLFLAAAVKIMPKDEGLDALLDAVIPWLEEENQRVLAAKAETAK